MTTTKELLVEREKIIQDREAELDLLRSEEAENEKKSLEMKAAQEKLLEEKTAMRQRIAELEVLLEEEKAANEVVVDADAFLDQTISLDPAVLSSVPGTISDSDVDEVFDMIFNPVNGTQYFVPVRFSQISLDGNASQI